MCGVRYEQDLADSKRLRAPLLQLVRAHADELVITWLGIPGENLLVTHGLPFYKFVTVQTSIVAVGYAPETIVCDLGSHVPVGWMTDEVGVPVTEALVEREVDLTLSAVPCGKTRASIHW